MRRISGRRTKALYGMLAILLASVTTVAFGHGAVVSRDNCVLLIGPYRMYFTGYQPRTQGSTEFCDDVPDAGPTIIVLDYIDEALRPLKVGLRFVRNVNLQGKPENDGEVVYRRPPQTYPRGTIKIKHRFPRPGYFVGIMTAITPSGEEYVARFPFSVGKAGWGWSLWLVLMVAAVAVIGSAWWWIRRFGKATTARRETGSSNEV